MAFPGHTRLLFNGLIWACLICNTTKTKATILNTVLIIQFVSVVMLSFFGF